MWIQILAFGPKVHHFWQDMILSKESAAAHFHNWRAIHTEAHALEGLNPYLKRQHIFSPISSTESRREFYPKAGLHCIENTWSTESKYARNAKNRVLVIDLGVFRLCYAIARTQDVAVFGWANEVSKYLQNWVHNRCDMSTNWAWFTFLKYLVTIPRCVLLFNNK
jgi:hypothetical protein